jgi:cytochrome c
MDSFEVNKILGAVLGTLTFTLAVSIGATLIFEHKGPATPGFQIEVPKTEAGGAPAAPPKVEPIAVRLAKADPKKGEALTKQCQSCHNFQKGLGPKVGPDLYGIVGEEIAAGQGFSFTAALKKVAAKEHVWTFANLDEWLTSPSTMAPGTAMSFAGISRPQQRADVIAYLNQNSAKPQPLPKPEAEAAPAPSKKTDAGAADIKAGANAAAGEQKAEGAHATGAPAQAQPAKPAGSAAPLPNPAQDNGKLQPPAPNPATQPAPSGTRPTPPSGTSTPQGANTPAGGSGGGAATQPTKPTGSGGMSTHQ